MLKMQFRDFFNLRENPFGESPDPQFYFPSVSHEAALQKLAWAIEENKSFLLVEGEVGVGKTLLSRTLRDMLGEEAHSAFVLHPFASPADLLAHICRDFGFGESLEELNRALLAAAAAGRRAVLIVDEAQSLSADCLELIRQLTNLETEKRKLLQIVFFAQPEFSARLAAPALRQLEQRLQLRISLAPLSEEDTAAYVRHRLEKAGGGNFVRFDAEALRFIYRQSRGAPRLVNKICELALRFAAHHQIRQITGNWLHTLPLHQVGVRPVSRFRELLGRFA